MNTAPPGLDLPPYPNDPPPARAAYEPRLPMDLWPNIVSNLPSGGLGPVTLVCGYFRKLAQPLLFRTLVVKPFAFNPKTSKTSPRSSDYQKWIAAKLSFYSTPRIATSVRACEVGPQDLFTDRSISEGGSDDPGRDIIDDVFEMLVQFQGLMDLTVVMIMLTDNNLVQLSRLMTLSSLTLMFCRCSAAAPSRLAVKNFVFGDDSVREEGLHILLSSMINPNKIESLSLVGGAALMSLPQLVRNGSFSKLRTLCLDVNITASPFLQSFLSKCSALEEIHFPAPNHFQVFMQQELDTSDLPSLRVYHGSDFNARNFTTGRPVHHVRLWGLNVWHESRDSYELMPYLKELNSSSELESLEFSVKFVTKSFLGEIFHLFSHLKALVIVVDSMEYENYGIHTRQVLMDTLSSLHLPPEIEHLSISKYFPWDHEDTPIEEFIRMKEYLTVYPALRYVSFSGDGFSWRFDAVTGNPLDAPRTIDDWRGSHLTRGMISKACRSYS